MSCQKRDLDYKGFIIHRNPESLVCLTDMWKAQGVSSQSSPSSVGALKHTDVMNSRCLGFARTCCLSTNKLAVLIHPNGRLLSAIHKRAISWGWFIAIARFSNAFSHHQTLNIPSNLQNSNFFLSRP